MASYTIITTRSYEIALTHNFEFYALEGETKQQFFQRKINEQVLLGMEEIMKRDKTVNLTASIATVPEANQPALQAAIEEDIIANGGTIITGPPDTGMPPAPPQPPAAD